MTLFDVIKAADFAAKKHRDQRRKDPEGTPYINHPIGVAHILANEGGIDDPIVLQAALLHDTVEDTDTTLEEIEENFGKVVRELVIKKINNFSKVVKTLKIFLALLTKCRMTSHCPKKNENDFKSSTRLTILIKPNWSSWLTNCTTYAT